MKQPPIPPHQGHWRAAPGPLLLAAGLLLVMVLALLHWLGAFDGDAKPDGPSPLVASAAPTNPPATQAPQVSVASSGVAMAPPTAAPGLPSAASAPRIQRQRDPQGDLTPDLSDYVNEGERPSMGEVIARLHAAGVHTGLGAFSPPGTRPALIGLAVPEDFALPPGYVRHHQATDDGQRIEAILMFAPDYQPLDAAGRPLLLPANRVVPAELAPPGLPLRRIVLPPPRDQTPSGH
ncbi:hypothetical protein RQP53_10615 [Paucibacter sp. APW11]|uniref:Type II secretion system protein GspC N-terminal domain-containing protein n=1 Tax=Roseateles aquae TaxID=3077235 RepID=A0ABU3PB05_9BURK|nr:hypothetical protein [Paucibacter sp. APW11]MDT8999719.1 hypothetical protein [Paucibacter sp. APW11]